MKTVLPAPSRPRRRALGTVLIGIAALWAMPTSARAQLYVDQTVFSPNPTGIVGEYNATTGAPIWVDANLSRGGVPGFFSSGLAVSGNTLFVMDLGRPSEPGRVGEYNAATGATINASFITGLNFPAGIVVSGNTLFVTSYTTPFSDTSQVGEYDATTGAPINARLIIQGLSSPGGVAVSGNDLFVVNNGTVGEYNAATGAAINANFITGLSPVGLAVSGNTLFVSSGSGVGEYNALTGAAINANFIKATGLIAVSGNTLFVSSGSGVGEYNALTGAAINATLIQGLSSPGGLAVAPAPVPEPSTWSMVAVGGVALLGIRLRKKYRFASV